MLYHVHLGTVKEVIKHNKIVYSKKNHLRFLQQAKVWIINSVQHVTLSYVIVWNWSLPVVIFESRSPVRGLEQGLQSAGQVDETIAHEEKHGKKRRQDVDVAQ